METGDNRTFLLNAALHLFAGKGFDAVSVEAIRREAGLSNGSFFHLYPSKAALAADLLVTSVSAYQAALLAPLEKQPDAATGVAAIISAKLDWVSENPERARFMLGEARAAWFALASGRLQALNDRFRDRIEAWRRPLEAAGALHPAPIDIFVATLVGPANLIARHWASGLRADPLETHAAGLIEAARRALTTA